MLTYTCHYYIISTGTNIEHLYVVKKEGAYHEKRAFVIALTIILCISAFSLSVFAAEPSAQVSQAQLLEIAEMQRGAIDAHETLYKTFLVEGVEMYPANYGGSYIDGSILHVCIVDLPNQDVSYYKSVLEDYLDIVTFDDVTFSLQTLITSSDEIAKNLLADGVPVLFEDGSALVSNAALMGGTDLTGYTLGICGTYNVEV